MTNKTLDEAIKLYNDCVVIKNILEKIEKTNVIPEDIITLDDLTYSRIISVIRITLRDTLKYKNKKLEEL